MLVFQKINFILLLTLMWLIFWIAVVISYDSYRDPILNYVPHSEDYLQNNPSSSYVSKPQKPKYVVMIGNWWYGRIYFKERLQPQYELFNAHKMAHIHYKRVMYYQHPMLLTELVLCLQQILLSMELLIKIYEILIIQFMVKLMQIRLVSLIRLKSNIQSYQIYLGMLVKEVWLLILNQKVK